MLLNICLLSKLLLCLVEFLQAYQSEFMFNEVPAEEAEGTVLLSLIVSSAVCPDTAPCWPR
jgi:hypothetical protein